MKRMLVIALASALVIGQCVVPRADAAPAPCNISGAARGKGVQIGLYCYKVGHSGNTTQPAPRTMTIFCGRPSSAANALWNPRCGPPRACTTTDKQTGRALTNDAFATLTRSGNHWTHPIVWCPAANQPAVNLTALRAQAQRLLPPVAIGSAWTDTALVNAQTILWAATTPHRTLPTVTLLGQPIHLRITFDHAHWNYGDNTQATHTTPGKAYDPTHDPCHTAQCPDYTGHTYNHTGKIIITLQISWHAQYSLTGHTWTDITGTITGPATHHHLTIKQTRTVLIPNPDEH